MRELAPFLKMYTEYVKNYDTAMHLIATWYQKQPRFAAIMDYVHVCPRSLFTLTGSMLINVSMNLFNFQ